MVAGGIMLGLAGIIMLMIVLALVAQNHAFKDAKQVTGTVTYKRRHRMKSGTSYELTLAYEVEGTAYKRPVNVSMNEFDSIPVGGTYEVLYRLAKPKKILRPKDTDPKNVQVVLIIAVVLTVVGVALFLIGRA